MTSRLAARAAGPALVALLLSGCGGEGPAGAEPGAALDIAFEHLPAVEPGREGMWEVWLGDGTGLDHSLGRLAGGAGTRLLATVPPAAVGASILTVTLEPPGDGDASPSPYLLLRGRLGGGVATLGIEGALTAAGQPLEVEPGAHSLFTSSNNAELGYPSLENAGLWLFSIFPDRNRHKSREVKLTALQAAWVYEGWIVHRRGTSAEVWISYGKFRPDQRQLLASRDDSGSGPFSGDIDYRNGGIEDVPGDEWTTNPFDWPVPGGLSLPFALDAVEPDGSATWTHVITIEPAFDEGEPILEARPFGLRPYANPIGPGGPAVPRPILPSGLVPAARATLR